MPPSDQIANWAGKAIHENQCRTDETGKVRALLGLRERMVDWDPWVLDQASGRWIHLASRRPENEREIAVRKAWEKWRKTGDKSDLRELDILPRSE